MIKDTIKTNLKLEIDLPKASVNLSNTRNNIQLLSLDTVKQRKVLKPKVSVLVKKVLPVVFNHDSLTSPTYNSFNNTFSFPDSNIDGFYFTMPNTNVKLKKTKKVAPKIKVNSQNKAIKAKEITKYKSIINVDRNTPKGFEQTDWTVSFLFISLLIIGFVNFKFNKQIKLLLNSTYNYFATKQFKEALKTAYSNVYLVLNLLFFINTSFVVTLWAEYSNITILSFSNIQIFFVCLLSLILIYSLKTIFFVILDFVFFTKKAFSEYNTTVFLYNKAYGIFLTPFICIIPFVSLEVSKYMFIICLAMFVVSYLARILRGFKIALINKVSILYLILYLCTLEIFPMLILLHTFEKYML